MRWTTSTRWTIQAHIEPLVPGVWHRLRWATSSNVFLLLIYLSLSKSVMSSNFTFFQNISKCINTCLLQAASNFKSIVFPAMGTGNLHYPRDLVAEVMYQCIQRFDQSNSSLKEIKFLCYDRDTIQVIVVIILCVNSLQVIVVIILCVNSLQVIVVIILCVNSL